MTSVEVSTKPGQLQMCVIRCTARSDTAASSPRGRSGSVRVFAPRCSVTVQLSGPARGTWTNETTSKQGEQLLDLVYRTGKHDTITAALHTGRSLIDEQLEARRIAKARRVAQAELRTDWKAHHALGR